MAYDLDLRIGIRIAEGADQTDTPTGYFTKSLTLPVEPREGTLIAFRRLNGSVYDRALTIAEGHGVAIPDNYPLGPITMLINCSDETTTMKADLMFSVTTEQAVRCWRQVLKDGLGFSYAEDRR